MWVAVALRTVAVVASVAAQEVLVVGMHAPAAVAALRVWVVVAVVAAVVVLEEAVAEAAVVVVAAVAAAAAAEVGGKHEKQKYKQHYAITEAQLDCVINCRSDWSVRGVAVLGNTTCDCAERFAGKS